jgi:hypothetical protein
MRIHLFIVDTLASEIWIRHALKSDSGTFLESSRMRPTDNSHNEQLHSGTTVRRFLRTQKRDSIFIKK